MLIDKQIHKDELKLRLLLTDDCNNECSFCLNDFQPKPKVWGTYLDSLTAWDAIQGYYKYFYNSDVPLQVYISGGEPTLHKNFMAILYDAYIIPSCRVTLNTNGKFANDLNKRIKEFASCIHVGTYELSCRHAEKIVALNGDAQCVYPYVTEEMIRFYGSYGIPIKVFEDFKMKGGLNSYKKFASDMVKKYPDYKLTFRHTGIQENRGLGCSNCGEKCITLKAAWVFPDGGTSPCPKLKIDKVYPKNVEEWKKYFATVYEFHKVTTGEK